MSHSIILTEVEADSQPSRPWTQEAAIELCRKVEAICPAFGCHVALTGGLLYKDGPRKDCDLLFYRIRQTPKINLKGLWKALIASKILVPAGKTVMFHNWLVKAKHNGLPVDCFFPDHNCKLRPSNQDSDYGP